MEQNESELIAFLKERIEKLGGSAQLQYLVGVLPNLRLEIRTSVANNRPELMRFLRKYSNIFDIDKSGNVKVHSSSPSFQDEEFINNENFQRKSKADSLPKNITGEGIVSKINPTYGFISAKSPIKTVIYFNPHSFGDKSKTLFTDFEGLAPGKKICFNAKKGSDSHTSKYHAYKVWYPKNIENGENSSPNPAAPNPRKTRETGLYDGVSKEGEGTITKLFPKFGFIAVDNDTNNLVFFHKDQLTNFQNVVDLTKALQIGNLVAFKALRTVKKDQKARWSASQVWVIKSGKIHKTSHTSKSNSKDESSEPPHQKREILRGEQGKIFPFSSGTIIKFGNQFEKLADADSSLFYMFGTQVKEVAWEFNDGDDVRFDAIEIKSHPGWKALLVWIGDKPNVVLEADLGDFGAIPFETENAEDNSNCISKSSCNSVKSECSDKSLKNSKSSLANYSSHVSSVGSKYKKIPSDSSSGRERLHKDFDTDDFSDSASYTSNRSSNASTAEMNKRYNKNRRNRNNSRSSYNSSNKSKMSRYSNGGKQVAEKGRFQRHLEFVSSDIKGSLDSVLDDNKSVCSDASTEKLTFLHAVNHTDKIYKNWGDSPYPDGDTEDMDILDLSQVSEDPVVSKETNNNIVDNDYFKSPSPIQSEMSNPCSDISKSSDSDKCDEIFNSDEDFSDVVTELNEPESLTELLKDSDQSIEENDRSSKKASVKCFHEIEGIVKKVYCKYAEIESSKLSKPSSFFWSDYYPNGNPITDEFDDLREIIKVGEVLKFNCIEIIDDDGMCFNKPTVLWKERKPTLVEITPEQYISQHNLCVSVSKDNYVDYYPGDNLYSTCTNPLKSVNQPHVNAEPELPVKKFLTVASSQLENEVETEFEATSREKEDIYDDSLKIGYSRTNETEEEYLTQLNIPLDRSEIISGISKLVKYKISPNNSMVDLNKISTEILDFVLNSTALNNCQSPSSNTIQIHKETQTETNEISTGDVQLGKSVEITHTESQTIFTGEVIGKSIYFDEH